ncbi:MAG: hypothetical protein AB7H77_11915, partial [Bdellovibrionales bacterium]
MPSPNLYNIRAFHVHRGLTSQVPEEYFYSMPNIPHRHHIIFCGQGIDSSLAVVMGFREIIKNKALNLYVGISAGSESGRQAMTNRSTFCDFYKSYEDCFGPEAAKNNIAVHPHPASNLSVITIGDIYAAYYRPGAAVVHSFKNESRRENEDNQRMWE